MASSAIRLANRRYSSDKMRMILAALAVLGTACVKHPLPPESQTREIPSEKQPAVTALQHTAPASGWRKKVDKSSFDDTKTVLVFLEADGPIIGWPSRSFTPAIVLRCQEKKTDAILRTGMTGHLYHGEGYNGDATVTRARYDKDETWEYVMLKSTDGEAYFFRNAIDEIKTMAKKNKLVIEFTPFNGSPQEIRFSLAGLDEHLPELRSTCGW